ncbi:MAG: dTDP-4-dehydrorhamnose reductase [Candidatus Margulisiibacteriota bacterium]
MSRILVLGANGMLGSNVTRKAKTAGHQVVALDLVDIDLTKNSAEKVIQDSAPEIIINCAAYTAVDKAQSEPELAMEVNAEGVRRIASAAKRLNCFVIHYSTDYVFDGMRSQGYHEFDEPAPLSVYGQSKLKGEQYLTTILPESQYLLLRTAWLYGPNGKNFVTTMIALANRDQPIRVVHDQIGCPTYTDDLSQWTLDLFNRNKSGLYHAVNSGICSWFDFAKTIYEKIGRTVDRLEAIPSSEYPTPAKRPSFSILQNTRLQKDLGYDIRKWPEALSDFLSSSILTT